MSDWSFSLRESPSPEASPTPRRPPPAARSHPPTSQERLIIEAELEEPEQGLSKDYIDFAGVDESHLKAYRDDPFKMAKRAAVQRDLNRERMVDQAKVEQEKPKFVPRTSKESPPKPISATKASQSDATPVTKPQAQSTHPPKSRHESRDSLTSQPETNRPTIKKTSQAAPPSSPRPPRSPPKKQVPARSRLSNTNYQSIVKEREPIVAAKKFRPGIAGGNVGSNRLEANLRWEGGGNNGTRKAFVSPLLTPSSVNLSSAASSSAPAVFRKAFSPMSPPRPQNLSETFTLKSSPITKASGKQRQLSSPISFPAPKHQRLDDSSSVASTSDSNSFFKTKACTTSTLPSSPSPSPSPPPIRPIPRRARNTSPPPWSTLDKKLIPTSSFVHLDQSRKGGGGGTAALAEKFALPGLIGSNSGAGGRMGFKPKESVGEFKQRYLGGVGAPSAVKKVVTSWDPSRVASGSGSTSVHETGTGFNVKEKRDQEKLRDLYRSLDGSPLFLLLLATHAMSAIIKDDKEALWENSQPLLTPKSKLPIHRIVACSLALTAFVLVQTAAPLSPSRLFHGCMGRRVKSQGLIDWAPCPDNDRTSCAYLSVPMDYTDPKPTEIVSLALRKLPATAPVKDRLGSLFINPGGPGGSGHAAVLRFGTELSVILEGRYDILSWDPRAVNLTSPPLNCFPTQGDGTRFGHEIEQNGLPFESNETSRQFSSWVQKFDAKLVALDDACQSAGSQGILRGSSTAFVVRDMISILDALGESKLSYWGFSYGTILGATFAAMFPDRIHRVVLDGVSDSAAYTNNLWEWGFSGMNDTSKTLQGFYDSCAESGPLGCALAKNGSSAHSIEQRVTALIEKLKTRPFSVGKSKYGPGVISASHIKSQIFTALYAPKSWPKLAVAIAELEQGNGTTLFEMANASNDKLARVDPADNVFHRSMSNSEAAVYAIMCSDSAPTNDTSLDTLETYINQLAAKSPTGEHWAMWVSSCRRWTSKAIETYRGPWTVAEGLNKTSYPIIFLSMTADPVTPLSAAYSMSAGFGPSSATLLIQKGFGHCSVSHPSLCTAKKVRAYFLEGKVPEYGTECTADDGFLFPHPKEAQRGELSTMSVEDRKLTEALESLSGGISEMAMRPPGM